MKTHARRAPLEEQAHGPSSSTLDIGPTSLDLDTLSDEELEDLLFDEEEDESPSFFNLPTVAGLSLITVGIAYLLQQLGILSGFDLSMLATMLPWLAGVLIILLGFGVLSWRPQKKGKKKKAVDVSTGKRKIVEEADARSTGKHRLTKSKRDRKIFGVCGGIAKRLGVDPTLVRIAFVIGTLFLGGPPPFVIAYLALAYFMPEPDASEERITIIRDSC